MRQIICFGEVLFDRFPDHAVIGGAPLNVAARLASFGDQVAMVSRVGADELGKEILEFTQARNIIPLIQVDLKHGTGVVDVKLDANGSATYDIVADKAWDFLSVSPELLSAVQTADLFLFGSLATRSSASRQTLFDLLEVSPYKVFDVNLRAPFYDAQLLAQLLSKADFIKCNDEELELICKMFDWDCNDFVQGMQAIARHTGCSTLCVTRGKDGALLLDRGHWFKNPGYETTVADTVGAGDSFLATLLHYRTSENAQTALDRACAMGALVASHHGANPVISEQELLAFIARQTN